MDGIKIPSLDAKDVFIADTLYPGYGYELKRKNGEYNLSRFKNVLDFSLDLIKLREVYWKVYRNKKFSWWEKNGIEYTNKIINVTFKYSNKEFNKIGSVKANQEKKKKEKNAYPQFLYVKFGYVLQENQIQDSVYVVNGELIGIQTGIKVAPEKALSKELLQGKFIYEDGVYKVKNNRTLNNVADLRNRLYKNGFWCNGTHYVRFKRSSGSSRVGKCLFIDEALYSRMHKWEMCGIKIKEGDEIDLAALEAYIALTLSSIIDTLIIHPHNILVIDDYESIFSDQAVVTKMKTDQNGTWLTTCEDTIEINNSIWDGQSLIDISLMGKYSQYGMVLLRNSFFKSCCFNTNIQKFFKDNNITSINQLNGFTLAKNIDDIKLITTSNSIKYLKFGTLKQWLHHIDSTFGVVKHEKKTHFFSGRLVQTHYQLLNTLQMTKQEVAEFLKPSLDYMTNLKTDPAVLRNHMKYPVEHEITSNKLDSKNEIIFQLLGLNNKFIETKWYKDFVCELIRAYKNNLKQGHCLVEGNYSTLFGNPYEMLLQSIGKFTGESLLGKGNVHSTRFEYGERLLGSRSPHINTGNILLVDNIESKEIDEYFNLTDEIVCINSIGENILQKLNGADFDSDTVLLTNNSLLISVAERNYHLFKVPTNMVQSKKTKRYYTAEQKADLDIKTSVNKIGDIINLSQELQTYMWHKINNGATFEEIKDLYYDTCQLAVMSNLEIDKAKKEFEIDNVAELKKLKIKWERRDSSDRIIKPYFFGFLAREKGYFNDIKKNYLHHDTTMDYLHEIINNYRTPLIKKDTIPLYDIFDFSNYNKNLVVYTQLDKIVDMIQGFQSYSSLLFSIKGDMDPGEKYQQYLESKENLLESINSLKINEHTLLALFKRLDKDKKLRPYIITILFNIGNKIAYEVIKKSKNFVPYLIPDGTGDINLYGFRYQKITEMPINLSPEEE